MSASLSQRRPAVTPAAPRIKVLVVDDSPTMRLLLQEIINRQPDMVVVGCAPEPHSAREMIKALEPDILTLDIEMPGMDGIDFLERVMRLHPMPVLMVSSMAEEGSELAMHALELGAIDIICKRSTGNKDSLKAMAEELTDKIRIAHKARNRFASARPATLLSRISVADNRVFSPSFVVCLGASTGGTEAIKAFLSELPANSPPILIAQHMPEQFTKPFAIRLNKACTITVKEAEHREIVQPGTAYIAPGHSHMEVTRHVRGGYQLILSQSEEVNRHRPSVDVLFDSAAKNLGKLATGVLLTGMGRDGALGLKHMHDVSSYTVAQDERSCIVFGMPKAARDLGAVDELGPPQALASLVLTHIADKSRKRLQAVSADSKT